MLMLPTAQTKVAGANEDGDDVNPACDSIQHLEICPQDTDEEVRAKQGGNL